MNKEQFIKAIEELNINYTEKQLEQLDKYYKLLVEWNKKMNLTSILDEKEVYLKHFYDSLTLVKIIDLNQVNSILDVGSGAGFPGVVLKIFFPHLMLDIIDSNNKKILFISKVVEELGLENVNLIHSRCEQYAQNNKEKYDLVTSRAVANLNTLIEISISLVKVGEYFVAMKGNIEEEIKQIDNELRILNGTIEDIQEFLLPIEKSQRSLVKIKKEQSTPKDYPRTYDKIKKKPL